jgi:hypothetical protein
MEGDAVAGVTQTIDVARDFSRVPGGRFARSGPHSGEEFRQRLLAPALQRARIQGGQVIVRFDGAAGYPVSFLEEAFGGLVRIDGFRLEELRNMLLLQAEAQRFQVRRDLAWSYIEAAATV